VTDIQDIVKQLEDYKRSLESAIRALQQSDGAHPSTPNAGVSAGRQRQIEAMRRYWAQRRGAGAKKATTKKSRAGGITPAGRKRLSEMMRKRWAAKRAG
jgi:hypothetical protein